MSVPPQVNFTFSVETVGNFDVDAEVDIYLSGNDQPTIALQFRGGDVVYDVPARLSGPYYCKI